MLHPCNKGAGNLCPHRSRYVQSICSYFISCHRLRVKAAVAGFLFSIILLPGCTRPISLPTAVTISAQQSSPLYTLLFSNSINGIIQQLPLLSVNAFDSYTAASLTARLLPPGSEAGPAAGCESFITYNQLLPMLLSITFCIHINWLLILLFFHKVKKNPPGHVAYTRMQRHILQKIILSKIRL